MDHLFFTLSNGDILDPAQLKCSTMFLFLVGNLLRNYLKMFGLLSLSLAAQNKCRKKGAELTIFWKSWKLSATFTHFAQFVFCLLLFQIRYVDKHQTDHPSSKTSDRHFAFYFIFQAFPLQNRKTSQKQWFFIQFHSNFKIQHLQNNLITILDDHLLRICNFLFFFISNSEIYQQSQNQYLGKLICTPIILMIKLLSKTTRYAFSIPSTWANAQLHKPNFGETQTVTLIPGIGIGPEITRSVLDVFEAANVPVKFEVINDFTFENIQKRDLLQRNKCILLGVMVPQKGVLPKYNDNHKFYKHLDLYANVNLCYSFPSVTNRHNNVDIAVVRENTEGEFSGIEHEVYPGVMESLKVTTKYNSQRLMKYAFQFAHLSRRKKITVVHKANIMKLVDGLFLECARQTAKKYPFLKYEEMIVDNCSMQLVKNPSQFDVMVAPNLYGTIISHIAAGITGGVGMTPGACIGNNYALFSQGMPHTGLNIAGKNVANPTSILISSVMMLRYLGLPRFADQISTAIKDVIEEKKVRTKDIGGHNSTTDFTQAIIHKL